LHDSQDPVHIKIDSVSPASVLHRTEATGALDHTMCGWRRHAGTNPLQYWARELRIEARLNEATLNHYRYHAAEAVHAVSARRRIIGTVLSTVPGRTRKLTPNISTARRRN